MLQHLLLKILLPLLQRASLNQKDFSPRDPSWCQQLRLYTTKLNNNIIISTFSLKNRVNLYTGMIHKPENVVID